MGSDKGGAPQVRLLGQFSIGASGRIVLDESWPQTKAKTAVKLLALQPGHTLHREQLFEALWPEAAPRAAANRLRVALHRLRSALAGEGVTAALIERSGSSLRLHPDTWTDVDAFRERAVEALRLATDPERYVAALDLYPGDLLPQDVLEEWTAGPREELSALRRRLLAELAMLRQLSGDEAQAERRLLQLLDTDPLDEATHRQLMLFYARTGRREQAVAQYERCRALLQERLGVEPGEETEQLCREVSAGSYGSAPPPAAPPAGSLVGREHEFAQLREAMDAALAGRGGVVLLEGEPGIGKTRLAEELTTYARVRGALVARGQCEEDEGAPAYWPWACALRDALQAGARVEPDDVGPGAPELAQVVPELWGGTPEAGRAPSIDGDTSRFRLFDAIAGFLKGVAQPRPLLLLLDDLHWADSSSLLLLHFLARQLHQTAALVLATYRSTEVQADQTLGNLRAELEQLPNVSHVSLAGLSRDEVARLIADQAGRLPAEALADAVYQKTEGNPFFAKAVVRLLLAEGRFDAQEGEVIDVPVPLSARDAIRRRLERLSAESRHALSIASVIGREFGLGILGAAGGLATGPLLAAIDEAIEAGLVVDGAKTADRASFAHALVRETLYEELTLSRRARLHQRVGEAIERQYASVLDAHVDELAHHFYLALPVGDAAKAARYARLAGDRAVALHAYEEAADHYARALQAHEYAEPEDERVRCEVMLALGRAQASSAVPKDALPALENAAALARQVADPQLFGQAAHAYSVAVGRSPLVGTGVAVPLLEEAIHVLGDGVSALKAQLLTELSLALAEGSHGGGYRERRIEVARRAVEVAACCEAPAVQAAALDALHSASYMPDRAEERLSIATEQPEAAQDSGVKAQLLWARMNRMSALIELGDMDQADQELPSLWSVADLVREPALMHLRPMWSASRALLRGQYVEAEHYIEELQAILERTQEPRILEVLGAQLFDLRRGQGRLGEMEPLIRPVVEERADVAHWLAGLSLVYLETGRLDDARHWFDRLALGRFADIPQDSRFMVTVAVSAEVACRLQDVDRAAALYELLRPHGHLNVVIGPALLSFGSAWRPLGQLAATLQRWQDAERHFQDALAFEEGIDARPWLARSQYEYALMLQGRAAPGDHQRASRLRDSAIGTFEALDMRCDLARARLLGDGGPASAGHTRSWVDRVPRGV